MEPDKSHTHQSRYNTGCVEREREIVTRPFQCNEWVGFTYIHYQSNLIMKLHPQRPHPPNKSEGGQLLKVEGEVGSERGLEESCDCLLVLEPHRCQTEEKGSTNSSKEPSPVVPDCKVCRCYLNAE